jgi:hypothetical protein
VSCTRCGHEPTTVTKMDTMNILLTDAVCGEAVPAWVESVDELDAEIVRCETLGWRAGRSVPGVSARSGKNAGLYTLTDPWSPQHGTHRLG